LRRHASEPFNQDYLELIRQTVAVVKTLSLVNPSKPGRQRRLTPDFPVADAVAISMSLPVIFKPASTLPLCNKWRVMN
jgi:hypothetical protein